jgi:flagellar hook-basal body complex protein FliE
MAVDIAKAVAAYAQGAARASAGALGPRAADPADNFASLVRDAAGSALDTMKNSEAMSTKALAGKADLNEVVTAVTNAEVTLQTVLAVRDRVIQAYQDIIRMPI